jgi:hypothetical protein
MVGHWEELRRPVPAPEAGLAERFEVSLLDMLIVAKAHLTIAAPELISRLERQRVNKRVLATVAGYVVTFCKISTIQETFNISAGPT